MASKQYKDMLLALLLEEFPDGFYHWVNGEFVFYVHNKGKVWRMMSKDLSMNTIGSESDYLEYRGFNADMWFHFVTSLFYIPPDEYLYFIEPRIQNQRYKTWKKLHNRNMKESEHYP